MDTHHDIPFDPEQLASDAFAAGLVLVSAAETAALADALQPLLEQYSPTERRAITRAWLVNVLQAFRAYPLAIATTPADLDLADLWRRARVEGVPADHVPLLREPTILSVTGHMAAWFTKSGFRDLDLDVRAICIRGWMTDVLDQMRASPVPLATGARQLDAPALLRARVKAWAKDDRQRRGMR